MIGAHTLESNRHTGTDDVLDLEVGELRVETKLLNDPSIFSGRKFGIIFRLCTSDDHFARREDEGRGLRIADTHDYCGETLDKNVQHTMTSMV